MEDIYFYISHSFTDYYGTAFLSSLIKAFEGLLKLDSLNGLAGPK